MSDEYWNSRAKNEYVYKGEKFYTITAIPYYYKRRKYVINRLLKAIEDVNTGDDIKVCDIGCGDGEYIKLLLSKTNNAKFTGIDVSEEMIKLAESRNESEKVNYYVSGNGILDDSKYDVIYMIASGAHISDEVLSELFDNVGNHLMDNGKFVIFEQTAPFTYGGEHFKRRTCSEYCSMLEKSNLKTKNIQVIDYYLHRQILERRLVKKLIKKYEKNGMKPDEIRIMLNKSTMYRMLSSVLTTLSYPYIYNCYKLGQIKNRWGYCYIESARSDS